MQPFFYYAMSTMQGQRTVADHMVSRALTRFQTILLLIPLLLLVPKGLQVQQQTVTAARVSTPSNSLEPSTDKTQSVRRGITFPHVTCARDESFPPDALALVSRALSETQRPVCTRDNEAYLTMTTCFPLSFSQMHGVRTRVLHWEILYTSRLSTGL